MPLLFAVGVNLAVLSELCVAMAFAAQAPPENFTAVFFKVFFGLLVPTLLLAGIGKRLLRGRAAGRDPAGDPPAV